VGPIGPAGTLSTMSASVYTAAIATLPDNRDVTFETVASIDTAAVTDGGASITLGGSGASAAASIRRSMRSSPSAPGRLLVSGASKAGSPLELLELLEEP
jgi:hypothetical protein